MPIHSALQLLNTDGSGALHLESIKLKRTNDYLSRFWFFKMVERTMFGALIRATGQDVPVQSLLSLTLSKP
jgi:hypothetical protein